MSAWLDQVLSQRGLAKGEPVRRNINDVVKYSSEAELLSEAKRFGFTVLKSDTHYHIFGSQILNLRIIS